MFWQICWLCRERWSFRGRVRDREGEGGRNREWVMEREAVKPTHPPHISARIHVHSVPRECQESDFQHCLSSPLHTRPTHTFIFSVFFTSCPAVQTVSKPANFIHAVSTSPKEGVGDNTRHSRLVDTATAASDYNPTTVSVSLNLKRKWLTVCRTEI